MLKCYVKIFEANLADDHEVTLTNLEDATLEDLTAEGAYIFVCSTYGDGDLPASAIDFGDMIEAEKPDLSAMTFSIFGLGDMDYEETYNNGSQRLLDLLMLDAVWTQHGPRGLHDASSGEPPEDSALPWVKRLLGRHCPRKACLMTIHPYESLVRRGALSGAFAADFAGKYKIAECSIKKCTLPAKLKQHI